ncbi:L-malyl-CoA/beta-methylmalyl-CoA lyase [Tepidimonas thermarum]|uniref:L-malyl-CoA/beta-methylmalyl-CoA lyase n=1 Tax=Tepidimonas thermarum TaxID=335431 RepID=A0A554WZA5_9BURK|nr:aldolase/citrate lyase family protein [Tepidimonas thermarum]TSE28909.1 L-malyl-CoA/beta-methylmalyl-CoA lyase [Tepidimonas thermarum]
MTTSLPPSRHPRAVLLGAQAGAVGLPVCDHYAGVEARMRKSLALQAEWSARHGACWFDVTLDCEDGAPVGAEAEHAALIVELVRGLDWAAAVPPRVAVRVHPVDHPAFEADVATIVGAVGARLTHVMLPKVESVADVERAAAALDAAGAPTLALHALIESPAAVHRAFDIAAHPRVASLSFGLMDFVSAHGGAIPATAMTLRGQFEHPLVRRAKLEIASAAHAHGKVPAHGVVTEFRDREAVRHAAERAAREFGYTRMWSIHPDQIEPIVAAFRPQPGEVEEAAAIIERAAAADWAPISHQGHLHDRASFRYFWQVLERAHATGVALPETVRGHFR